MICLRCGECCGYMVAIVVEPQVGPAEGNLEVKEAGARCRHLRGDAPPFACAIHDEPWFPETPCGRHYQYERHEDEYCRIGNYRLNGITLPQRASEGMKTRNTNP